MSLQGEAESWMLGLLSVFTATASLVGHCCALGGWAFFYCYGFYHILLHLHRDLDSLATAEAWQLLEWDIKNSGGSFPPSLGVSDLDMQE